MSLQTSKELKSELEVHKYLLQVVEEMAYSACPKDLILKYQKLKQISLNKISESGQYFYEQFIQLFSVLIQQSTRICKIIQENSIQKVKESDFESLIQKQLLQKVDSICKDLTKYCTERENVNYKQFLDKQLSIFDQNKIQLINQINQMYRTQKQYLNINQQSQIQQNNQLFTNTKQDQILSENSQLKQKLDQFRINNLSSDQNQDDEYQKIIFEINNQLQSNQLEESLRNQNLKEQKAFNSEENMILMEKSQLFVKQFEQNFSPYIEKYADAFQQFEQNKNQKQQNQNQIDKWASEKNKLLDFILHLFQKFESDNFYLVEKLQELSKENHSIGQNVLQYQKQCEQGQQVIDLIYTQLNHDIVKGKDSIQQYENAKNNISLLLSTDYSH